MAKQINVNLAFNADVSQAKAQIQDLQNSLNSISTAGLKNGTGAMMAEDLKKASAAALDLQIHLKNAVNQDTGKLDFARFNESIKKSGNSLNAYADTLRKLGPQGEEAFIKLARAVSNSEIPLMRSNTLLNNMWVAMKNTARWQLSSSALHAFMGTMSSAYNYAKDLNSSLNNIRIVTGYSTDQMAKFAKEANKSAKALNATTTEYTNASLIYYQQGLSDDEVKKRTDVTIKMANVSRESAQVVSDQMTAVWNNFAKGGENLEYYADVMTALGAATASSTAEISAGLEKFAAIAETVGLSYEYSTAALATITATTRQSADVVGNALKTLFARIQGLSLGETLEDGVNLNKYSEALDTVGVKVLDANGQMREMDDILDDLAAKWDTIGKAEQTALAQTVAGVRQYTQLVALMDNWDFMKKNLDVAYNSSGALQEQADIYAESWEAAGDRVRAAAENIFDSVLEDKFFIDMLNDIESVLSAIGKLVDSLGGMHGVVAALGVVFTKVFSTQMQTGLENLAYTLKMSTPSGMQSVVNEKLEFFNTQRTDLYGNDSEQSKILASESQLQKQFITAQLNKTLSPYQTELIQAKMNQYTAFNDERIAALNNKDIAQMNLANAKGDLFAKLQTSGKQVTPTNQIQSLDDTIDTWIAAREKLKNASDEDMTNYGKQTQALENAARELAKDAKGKDIVGKKQIEDYVKQRMAFKEQDKKVAVLNAQGGTMQEDLDKTLKGANQGMISWSATAVSAARATGQLAMGINSLKAAFTAIKDPDASGWEKFSSVLMSLSFAIPALINGWQGLKGVIALLNAETIALGLNSVAQWANAKSRMGGAVGILTGSKGDVKKQAAVIAGRRNAARIANWDKKQTYKDSDGSLYRVKQGQVEGGGLGTPYIVRASGHNKGKAAPDDKNLRNDIYRQRGENLKKANLPKDTVNTVIAGNALKSIGKILVRIGPYAAAIGGVAVAINLASKAWHAHETAATNAAKTVEEATKNYQNTVNKLNSFKQSVESFENAKKNLAELTRGTEAYSEGIKKANEEAKKLIETYNLYGQFTYDSDGLIKFNEGVLDNIEAQKEQAVLSAENLKYFAEYDLSEANLQRQKTDLSRKMIMSSESGYSATIDDVLNAFQDYQQEQESGKTNENFTQWLSSTGNKLAQFNAEISPNIPALENLADSVKTAGDAADYFTKAILQNKIKEKYGDQIAGIADSEEEESLLTSALAERELAVNEKVLEDYGTYTGFTGIDRFINGAIYKVRWNSAVGALNDKDLMMKYAEAIGYTKEELSQMVYQGGFGKGKLTDLNGNTIVDWTSDQEKKEYLYRQQYLDKNVSTENTQEGIGYLNKLKTNITSTDYNVWNTILSSLASGEKMMNFALEDYKNISESDYNKLRGITDSSEFIKTLGLSEADLANTPWANEFDSFMKEFWDAYYKDGNGNQEWQEAKFQESIYKEGETKAEEYGLDIEEFKAYRDLLYEYNEELREQPELLNAIAIAQKRYEKGAKALKDIQKDNNSILKKGNEEIQKFGKMTDKTSSEVSKFQNELQKAVGDLLDLSDEQLEFLDPDFAIENWDLIQKALNGSKEAYRELQKAAANDTLEDVFNNLKIEGVDTTELEGQFSSLTETLQDLANEDPIEIQGKLNDSMFLEACTRLVNQAGMTAAQAQAYFDDLGYDAEVEVVDGPPTVQEYSSLVPYVTYSGTEPFVMYKLAQGRTVSTNQYLRIKSINKKSTDGPSAPSGGGGGGGGGGSKAPEKPKEHKKERYYTLTNQLEDISKEYDEISAAAERAFGKDKLDLIDQQIAKTEEQIEKQKELVAAVEANIPGDQKNLIDSYNKLFNGAGPQFQFDERGIISNFDEIQDYIWEQYQIAEAEDNKELKADLDAWMALYEETRDKLNDEQAKLKELERQQLDLALQKIEYEIELRVELAEDELDFLDYQLSKIEDDAFKAAEAIANLNKQMSELGDISDANLAGITKILQNKGLSDEEINAFLSGDTSVLEGKGLEESEVEALRGYRDGLIDTNEQFQELRENVEEQLSEVFDAWQEKLQEGVDKVQHFGSVLEAYGNIIDIVGEKTLGITDDFLKDLSDKVVDNAIDNLKAVRSQYEATQKTLAEAQAHLDDAIAQGDEDMIKYWTEQVRTISQEADSLSEEVLGAWEEALNKVVEVFEAAVETAVEKFNDAIYELGGLEGLSADFEKQQELADMYLEDYQKIYELSKLNRNITKSMDDMESISGKRKLRDLQKEINDLQASGVELSEYDLEYLQKKYDLRMAEIALEEAQNAKDTVRLQKDNEGNYSYVYTANTDAVDEAQQKYEDALYSMQDLSSNYIDEMSSMIIDASQQMSEELATIRRQDYETEEEYQEALRRVEDYWMERIGRQKNELDKAVNNNKTLYDEDWTNYHNATGYKISDTDKFVTDFSDSMLSALMGVESSGALMNIISNATAGLIEDLLEASKEFGRRTEEIMNEAGTSVKDFAGDVDEASKNIADASKKAADSVGQMGDDMIEDFNNVADSIHDFQIRYIEEIQPIIDANERVVQSLNDIIESAAGLDGLSIGMKDGRYVIEIPSGEQGETSNPPASASMDTGGYTGDWSDNKGRLAWVHKRELMLNQEDTLNVLKAVELTKMMLQTIELNAQQAASGFGVLNATGLPQEEVQTLQQEVHITAEFPNVQDSNEIKDAFNTLINTASQYANRK